MWCAKHDLCIPCVPSIPQILLQNKYLEQHQVGEMAMVPSSDARERLYRLLRDRCGVRMESVNATPRDAMTTFWL